MVAEHNLDSNQIQATGKGGRITKEDVEKHLQTESPPAPPKPTTASVKAIRRQH